MFADKKLTSLLSVSLASGLLVIYPAVSSKADTAQARQNFAIADVNNDLKLNPAEFKRYINLNADHNIGRAATVRRVGAYGKAFSRLDANGDGLVTRPEIKAAAN